jgi:hypothetical protein
MVPVENDIRAVVGPTGASLGHRPVFLSPADRLPSGFWNTGHLFFSKVALQGPISAAKRIEDQKRAIWSANPPRRACS